MGNKTYEIFCYPPDNETRFVGECTSKKEAEEWARKEFAKRTNRKTEVVVRQQKELLRLRPAEIGFRVER